MQCRKKSAIAYLYKYTRSCSVYLKLKACVCGYVLVHILAPVPMNFCKFHNFAQSICCCHRWHRYSGSFSISLLFYFYFLPKNFKCREYWFGFRLCRSSCATILFQFISFPYSSRLRVVDIYRFSTRCFQCLIAFSNFLPHMLIVFSVFSRRLSGPLLPNIQISFSYKIASSNPFYCSTETDWPGLQPRLSRSPPISIPF